MVIRELRTKLSRLSWFHCSLNYLFACHISSSLQMARFKQKIGYLTLLYLFFLKKLKLDQFSMDFFFFFLTHLDPGFPEAWSWTLETELSAATLEKFHTWQVPSHDPAFRCFWFLPEGLCTCWSARLECSSSAQTPLWPPNKVKYLKNNFCQSPSYSFSYNLADFLHRPTTAITDGLFIIHA